MSDYLPVDDLTDRRALENVQRAVDLGLAPAARAARTVRLAMRPGINPISLPKKKGVERQWPQKILFHHGVLFERFEDNRIVFQTDAAHMVINGSPVAYHPFNQKALGKIEEQQARGFCALVKNEAGELVRQGPGDPVPGHLVSRTAYQHKGFEASDPRRYLDAGKVPYVSVPLEMMLEYRDHWPLILGSTAVVRDRSRGSYRFLAVVGDVDTTGVGGISKVAWETLAVGRDSPMLEFQIFAGVAHKGFELQRWHL